MQVTSSKATTNTASHLQQLVLRTHLTLHPVLEVTALDTTSTVNHRQTIRATKVIKKVVIKAVKITAKVRVKATTNLAMVVAMPITVVATTAAVATEVALEEVVAEEEAVDTTETPEVDTIAVR